MIGSMGFRILVGLFSAIACANAWALPGKLEVLTEKSNTPNWSVARPRVIFAMGYLDENSTEHYAKVAQKLEESLAQAQPGLKVDVLKYARSSEIVMSLRAPDVVGLIVIAHSYQTKLGTAILLGADYTPLPNELISAATPALRFVALLGCHGPSILKQYQAQYELERLPGEQRIYYTMDKLLTTNQLLIARLDGVSNSLKALKQEIGAMKFQDGVQPAGLESARLKLVARDVVDGIEPRYVYFNGSIIGAIGARGKFEELQPADQEFSFQIPLWNLKMDAKTGKQKSCVGIRASELTPGSPADDYLLKYVEIRGERLEPRSKTFNPPLHLGDDEKPYTAVLTQPRPLSPAEKGAYRYRPEYMKEIEKKRFIEYLMDQFKSKEWVDRDETHWPSLLSRFYFECLP